MGSAGGRSRDAGLSRLHDRDGGPASLRTSRGPRSVCRLHWPGRWRPGHEAMGLSPCRPGCPDLSPGPGTPGCVLRSPREAVSATLTCACMSTVVRTGRDAKAADWVPVSRDPRPLMGSRHATPEPDGPGARAPATPATFEFQPSRCKLAAQSAEANPRRRRRREPITVPSASGTTPPESGLLSSDQARDQTPWILLPDPLFLSSPSPPSLRGAPCTSALLPEASGCVRRARACGRQRAKAPAQGQGGTGAT